MEWPQTERRLEIMLGFDTVFQLLDILVVYSVHADTGAKKSYQKVGRIPPAEFLLNKILVALQYRSASVKFLKNMT
jgi:hypothetical protein